LRSPSTVRAGTREVHNKLEKNRRAHLKECFESLKRQLPITADEKKTSNLSILGAAIRHIQVNPRENLPSFTCENKIKFSFQQFLKRKEREYEHEMERLAKEKIAAQNRILFLKRELAQWDVDFSKLLPEQNEINAVKSERSGKG
jgi:MAX-binding protein